jgi:hypothetical protein
VRDALERRAPHAGHQLHIEDHVRAVGDLDAASRKRRVDRPHAIRDDIQGTSFHAAGEQGIHLDVGLRGIKPVVVRPGVFLVPGANEGQVFDARHVRRIGAGQNAAGKAL